jgi:hypothetical protein
MMPSRTSNASTTTAGTQVQPHEFIDLLLAAPNAIGQQMLEFEAHAAGECTAGC